MTTENHRLRVKAGRRAFLEHMPLRASLALYDGQDRELYAKDIIGDLLEVSRLDVRSYRDTPVCNNGVESKFEVCPDIYDPDRSMLGRAQERWLFDNFGKSDCKWNCLAQTTVMSPFDRVAGPAIVHESESWDNYAANRSRIVDHIRDREIPNVVSLGGNIHAFYAGKVSDGVAQGICKRPALTEIVTTSITAGGGAQKRYIDIHRRRNENPCIDYFDNRYRGYALVTFTRQEVRADLRKVEDVAKPDSNIATLAKLSIPDGEIGIRQLS